MHRVHKARNASGRVSPSLSLSLYPQPLLSLKTAVVKLTDNPDINLLRLCIQMREISVYARRRHVESRLNKALQRGEWLEGRM